MSGARLRIRRAKDEAQKLGPIRAFLKGLFNPAWYSWANDTSGFEKTCPLGYDETGPIEYCPARDGINYDCRACEDLPYEETAIE